MLHVGKKCFSLFYALTYLNKDFALVSLNSIKIAYKQIMYRI